MLLPIITSYRLEENLCQLYTRQGTDNQNIQGAQKTKLPKIHDLMGKWTEQQFCKRRSPMAKKHMNKCSPSLAIKETQINTRLRFQLTPLRIATIKNTNNNKCWQECGEKGTHIHCWWECKLVQLWKTVGRSSRTKNRTAMPLLGIFQITTQVPTQLCLLQHYAK
jgi:hypothetical protein